MVEQILFYTKIILIKNRSAIPANAINQLIRYDPSHYADDKTYKKVQYRKLYGKHMHQLVFINRDQEYLSRCFDHSDDDTLFRFNFEKKDVVSISTVGIMPIIDEGNQYLYQIKDYCPFNINDYEKWKIKDENDPTWLDNLGSQLVTHLGRILEKTQAPAVELHVQIHPQTVEHRVIQYKDTKASYFDFAFKSNLHIPSDLNIGRRAAINGILNLINIEQGYDN